MSEREDETGKSTAQPDANAVEQADNGGTDDSEPELADTKVEEPEAPDEQPQADEDDTDAFTAPDGEDFSEDETRTAMAQPADAFDDLETREVPVLKDEWREKAKAAVEEEAPATVVGDWVDEDSDDGSLAASVAAASGELPLPQGDDEPQEVAGPVLNRAREAQQQWSALRFEQRIQKFHALRDELVEQRNDYAPSMATAIGRPMVETLTAEYLPVLEALRSLEEVVPPLLVDQHSISSPETHRDLQASVRMVPYGVVLIANSSRSPFALPMTLAIDAVATGNAVVICGAEVHPRINETMRKLFQRTGFPEDLVQVLAGDSETLRAVIDARPDKVFFEGDAELAARVATKCALNGCDLEVLRASKDILAVLGNADVDHAVQAALYACFSGGGMTSGTAERVVVDGSIYDEFRMKLMEGIREMNSHHAQLASIKDEFNPRRAKLLVEDAVAKGARVTYPAGEEPGRWIHWKAAVVENLDPKAKLSRETFEGPGCALYRADEIVGEIRKLLDVAPANNLSVLGQPDRATEQALDRLGVARLAIGEALAIGGGAGGGAPLGSEITRTSCGPLAMMRPKVALRGTGETGRIAWFPYTDDKAYAIMDAMEAMYSSRTSKRLKASFKLALNPTVRRLLHGEE